ncbi:MAG: hypothetical protein EZS28_004189 [Streblomastix strix]|uniref:Uncharacterized protein n=1 Tax=Streblomastix strix TaxID=222440 RepID=A0A5J4WZH1_9EUKA|nr:MAG: hypothetical protein EZS28_004189 [Streblomastix strix]
MGDCNNKKKVNEDDIEIILVEPLMRFLSYIVESKFPGTPNNIPLNAVLFAIKDYRYPILWNGTIPIDCHINPNGNVTTNAICQISLPDDFCEQVCDSYAIHNQSAI